MAQTGWKRLSNEWPILFCLAVAIWFGVSAIDLPDRARSIATHTSNAATAEPEAVNVSRGVDVTVQKLYLDQNATGTLTANATLEITNTSGADAVFRTSDLALMRSDGNIYRPAATKPNNVSVGRTVPVLTTVQFPVESWPGAHWTLRYNGKTIFQGIPR